MIMITLDASVQKAPKQSASQPYTFPQLFPTGTVGHHFPCEDLSLLSMSLLVYYSLSVTGDAILSHYSEILP